MAIEVKNEIIQIERFELGPFGTNSYIMTCLKTGDSIVVDAPGDAGKHACDRAHSDGTSGLVCSSSSPRTDMGEEQGSKEPGQKQLALPKSSSSAANEQGRASRRTANPVTLTRSGSRQDVASNALRKDTYKGVNTR